MGEYTHLLPLWPLLRYSLVGGEGRTGIQRSAVQERGPGWRSTCGVISILMVFTARRLVQLSKEGMWECQQKGLVLEP